MHPSDDSTAECVIVDEKDQQQWSQSLHAGRALCRCVDDAPALLTALVLHSYAQIVAAKNAVSGMHHNNATGTTHLGDVASCAVLTTSPYKRERQDVASETMPQASRRAVPLHLRSIEEALAPLELLHGRVFISAVGIALHGSEPILRVVEQTSPMDSCIPSHAGSRAAVATTTTTAAAAGAIGSSSSGATHRAPLHSDTQSGVLATLSCNGVSPCARFVYRVGEYTLLSPYHCPCSAYAYQSVKRRETWFCKHLLALQIVLHLEAVGVRPDNLRIRLIDRDTFNNMVFDCVVQ